MSVPTDIFTEPCPCQVCEAEGPCYLDTEALIAYCLPCLESAIDHAARQQAANYPGDDYGWDVDAPFPVTTTDEQAYAEWVKAEEVRNFWDFLDN